MRRSRLVPSSKFDTASAERAVACGWPGVDPVLPLDLIDTFASASMHEVLGQRNGSAAGQARSLVREAGRPPRNALRAELTRLSSILDRGLQPVISIA